MNCNFKSIAPNHYKCDICGFEIRINEDPSKIYRSCEKVTQDNIPNIKPEFPSLAQQAKNFIGSMIDYAQDGFQNVSDEEHDKRMAFCAGTPTQAPCEFYVGGNCSKCGCSCNFKSRMKAMKCPIGKW